MRCYYAHCIALYNTPQEARDLLLLDQLGFDVLNPNLDVHDAAVKYFKARGEGYMEYFKGLISSCDLVAFRALPDGRIPSGVGLELVWAEELRKPIIELPTRMGSRTISLEETREYLQEVGQR